MIEQVSSQSLAYCKSLTQSLVGKQPRCLERMKTIRHIRRGCSIPMVVRGLHLCRIRSGEPSQCNVRYREYATRERQRSLTGVIARQTISTSSGQCASLTLTQKVPTRYRAVLSNQGGISRDVGILGPRQQRGPHRTRLPRHRRPGLAGWPERPASRRVQTRS